VSGPGKPLDELEAYAVLDRIGIPHAACATMDARINMRPIAPFSYPLVVKALSAAIAHKSDAGGVVLGLRDEPALTRAVADLEERLRPPALSVERMAPVGDGVELLVGARWDRRFGPIVLVGLGGLYTEILRDVAVALAPVDADGAERLLLSLRAAPLLRGARGRPPLDTAAAAEAIERLSRVAASHPEIAEIEVNPLLVTAEGALGLDARLVPASGEGE